VANGDQSKARAGQKLARGRGGREGAVCPEHGGWFQPASATTTWTGPLTHHLVLRVSTSRNQPPSTLSLPPNSPVSPNGAPPAPGAGQRVYDWQPARCPQSWHDCPRRGRPIRNSESRRRGQAHRHKRTDGWREISRTGGRKCDQTDRDRGQGQGRRRQGAPRSPSAGSAALPCSRIRFPPPARAPCGSGVSARARPSTSHAWRIATAPS
jgi:hypothetical protein